jgi:hypothetical protein
MTSRPSTVEFCQILFPSATTGLFAVLAAYIDDSGNPSDSPSVVLSAFVARPRIWDKVCKKWSKIVQGRYRVRVFHATDCSNGRGEFAGWPQSKRDKLFSDLIGVIEQYKELNGFSAAVSVKDYKGTVTREAHNLFQGPYSLAFQLLIQDICKRYSEKVAFVMDRPNKEWGKLEAIFHSTKLETRLGWPEHLHSFTGGSAKDCVPIQVADVLAYETYRDLNRRLEHSARNIRTSLLRLLGSKPLEGGYFDRAALRELISRCKKDGRL